ncbi:MAG: ectoine synthase [Gammaproteobacteria bacterium]|nr:ectoine synthase [Gammaproteobacteria bacterium]
MIVRTLQQAEKSERRIVTEMWESTRLLLENDKMGFSFHITTIYKNARLKMHYKNHLESVYCISGEGELEDLANGNKFPITEGTIYILDRHDKHILRATTEMKMACVFNPPLIGKETHDKDGSYEIKSERVMD